MKFYKYLSISTFIIAIIIFVLAYFTSAQGIIFNFESPRFNYHIWLLLLSLIIFFLYYFRFWYLLQIFLLLFFIDLTMGFGKGVLARFDINIDGHYPNNYIEHRFEYHPLLVGIPKKNLKRQEPFLISHNQYNQRSVPENKENSNLVSIPVFGGSSTYDISLSDNDTWVNQLQIKIGDKANVINNGVPGYSSVEHLIQTIFFSKNHNNNFSKCSVYYMGWNDIRNFGISKIINPQINFHLSSQAYTLRLAYPYLFSPFFKKIISYFPSKIAKNNLEKEIIKEVNTSSMENDLSLKMSLNNVIKIIQINKNQKIISVFIPQLLNFESLKSENAYGWIPFVADRDLEKLIKFYNNKIKKISESLDAIYLDIDYKLFDSNDFVDQGHFSPNGASKFASLISSKIIKNCI